MALVISISFLLLVLPQTVFDIVYKEWKLDKDLGKDVESYVTHYIGLPVVYFLVDINHCINIFLHFVSGATFRSDALQLMMCNRLCGKENSVIRTRQKKNGNIRWPFRATQQNLKNTSDIFEKLNGKF